MLSLENSTNGLENMQSRFESFLEANINTFSGFMVSYILAYTVLPLYGAEQSHIASFQITMIFTVASLLRNYIIRRYFNKRKIK